MSSPEGKSKVSQQGEIEHGPRNSSSFNLYNDMKKTKDFQKGEEQLTNRPPYYSSDTEGAEYPGDATAAGNEKFREAVKINYKPDINLSSAVFKCIAEKNQNRIDFREFQKACSALGIECTVAQMREVFMEIDQHRKEYISMDDFIKFLQPHEEDTLVNVRRKLQMNITELSTDDDQSDSSGDNYFEHGGLNEENKADERGGTVGGPMFRQATLQVTFGPKYTVKMDQEKIRHFLIPGTDTKNAYVKKIKKGSEMAKILKSGSKVIQVNSYHVTGLAFDEIKRKMTENTIVTLVLKHPDNISRDEIPFDPYEDGENTGNLVIPLLGSPPAENDSKATSDRLKKELPCYPFWQYPLLIIGELLTVLLYWTIPFLFVLVVAFSSGILVGFYKLLRIIWDDDCRGWSMIHKRHFTGTFQRVGDYLNLIRSEWIEDHSDMNNAGGESCDEPSVFTSWFVKFSCIKCGDWNVKQVICYMGPLLNKEWVAVFQNRDIDGKSLEMFQTAEALEEIDPDYKARDSKKRRQKMAKHIAKQFGHSTGLKIAKSFQALFYSIFLGPMLVLWMWAAWIRRVIPSEGWVTFSESPTRYIKTYIFHSPLPVQADCWPSFRHSPKRDTWRIRVFLTMEDETYSLLSYVITMTIMLLIFVSTMAYILATLPDYEDLELWNDIEWVVSFCFTFEYGIRILVCRDMWTYFIDLLNLIDFLAVIPFWIEWLSMQITGGSLGDDTSLLRVIRVIRLARVVRLLKSKRFAEYLAIFNKTLQQSMESFGLLVTIVFLETIICASLIFVTERGVKDDNGVYLNLNNVETEFKSIPEAAYWCIVTMTTVGYGDQYPITMPGKIVGCITMFTGLLVIALPVIIVGGNFEQVYQDFRKSKELEDKRDKIVEAVNRKELAPDALERYERGKRSVIELAMEVNEFLQRPNFLTYDHVKHFLAEDFDSRDRIVAVLRHKHGFAFLPQQIDKYRRFILYESYGKYLRKGNKPKRD